jgi:hypothetical protein
MPHLYVHFVFKRLISVSQRVEAIIHTVRKGVSVIDMMKAADLYLGNDSNGLLFFQTPSLVTFWFIHLKYL